VERIIVRRGRLLTYELLRRTFGVDPNVEIIWDRRKAERTAPPLGERRGSPPVEWERLDYIYTRQIVVTPAPVMARPTLHEPPA
jgi:hypothetical protein